MSYYNEHDPQIVTWLRELVARGCVPDGFVDDRDIQEVEASKVRGRTAHFFAGIGGWPLALEIAGWDNSYQAWTGSCPCQPFSVTGRQGGESDERHIWPEFFRLIAQCLPPVIFGEQVASPLGREWLSGVRNDLEALGYFVGAADLCAPGVGAPHIRQRLYFGAWLGDPECLGLPGGDRRGSGGKPANGREASRVANSFSERSQGLGSSWTAPEATKRGSDLAWVDDTNSGRLQVVEARNIRQKQRVDIEHQCNPLRPSLSAWDGGIISLGEDGKHRRIEPGTCPLAHGVPDRVGRLRGYGNAIVPQLAAEFICAFTEACWIEGGWD